MKRTHTAGHGRRRNKEIAADNIRISFIVPRDLRGRIEAEAARCRLSLSEWLRLAIETIVTRRENPYLALMHEQEHEAGTTPNPGHVC